MRVALGAKILPFGLDFKSKTSIFALEKQNGIKFFGFDI